MNDIFKTIWSLKIKKYPGLSTHRDLFISGVFFLAFYFWYPPSGHTQQFPLETRPNEIFQKKYSVSIEIPLGMTMGIPINKKLRKRPRKWTIRN